MTRITDQLRSLIQEEDESMDTELDLKQVLAQLAVSMKAMGLDPANKEHAEKFAAVMKMLSGPKKATFLGKVGNVSDVKLTKAARTAKASL